MVPVSRISLASSDRTLNPRPMFRIQHAFPGEPEQGLPHRGAAHAEQAGHLGVPDSAPDGMIAAVDPFQQLAIDLVSEGSTGYDGFLA